jgi:hypothetical protein
MWEAGEGRSRKHDQPFDLGAYDAFHRQELPDYELDQEAIRAALAELPKVPA